MISLVVRLRFKLQTSFVLLQTRLLYTCTIHMAISDFGVGMKPVPNNLIASKRSASHRCLLPTANKLAF